MNKQILIAGLLVSQAFIGTAFAAGEVDAADSKAAATKIVTPEEKKAARAERKANGAVAAKATPVPQGGEVALGDSKSAASGKVSAEEKKAARAKRKAEGAAAAKAEKSGQ